MYKKIPIGSRVKEYDLFKDEYSYSEVVDFLGIPLIAIIMYEMRGFIKSRSLSGSFSYDQVMFIKNLYSKDLSDIEKAKEMSIEYTDKGFWCSAAIFALRSSSFCLPSVLEASLNKRIKISKFSNDTKFFFFKY